MAPPSINFYLSYKKRTYCQVLLPLREIESLKDKDYLAEIGCQVLVGISVILMEGNMIKRNAFLRLKKYEAKLDPEVIKKRFEAERKMMIEQEANLIPELCELEESAKVLIDEGCTSVIKYPFYLAYARELWRLTKRYGGNMLLQEIRILEMKWEARELDPSLLEKIRVSLFGINIT
jgi:hypothetical protein